MNACFPDTSTMLDLIRERPPAVAAAELYDEQLLPFVVLGELFAGAHQARNPDAEFARLERWLLAAQVFDGDEETAFIYGELLADLERRGCRIPTNDL